MKVSIKLSALGQTKWHEYVSRFFFGGVVTVLTGLIAKKFGPAIGGLFLAFPAIFPASATLIEKHEKQKKERVGLHGTERGRMAVGLDAAGAAMGSVGLLAFGLTVWRELIHFRAVFVLSAATLVWLLVSISIWYGHKVIRLSLS
jgi:uncharacterized protein DUF3147